MPGTLNAKQISAVFYSTSEQGSGTMLYAVDFKGDIFVLNESKTEPYWQPITSKILYKGEEGTK